MSMTARFLPWVRPSSFAGDAIVVRAAGADVNVPISRYGPGDVAGIAAGQIRRRDPLPGSLAMPPNLFPSVEFSSADFPWSISPGAPDANGRLQPWLALIVVAAPAGNPLATVADAKLPAIEVARNELPSMAEMSLWAHTQIRDGVPATEEVIRQGIARVLSPCALEPTSRYLACLVPTFEAGRLAGLGKPVPDARSAAPAWSAGPGKVLLPVYDSWFFTTANSGDLETLARRLRGCDLAATSRPKQLDVSAVSGNVAGKLAPFEGALRPLNSAAPWTGTAVNAAANRIRTELEHTPASGVPVVGLPVYGSIPSGQTKPVPGWLNDLNLDPRRRSAAGLGAAMVRQRQEQLVDQAWSQAGDVERARREREGALLADFVSGRLNARMMAPLTGAGALVAMAPSLARTRDSSKPTLAARVGASVVPTPVLDAGFRRILATKAPLAARKAGQGIRRSVAFHNTLAIRPGSVPPSSPRVATAARFQAVMQGGSWGSLPLAHAAATVDVALEALPAKSTLATATVDADPILARTAEQTAQVNQYAVMALQFQPQLLQVVTPNALAWPSPPPPAAGPLSATARFESRVSLTAGARVTKSAGVVTVPGFPQPLAAWLDAAFLLAGIEIPPDAAGLLETNSPFIEALLVGANHELARELLWRGVPMDRTGTPLVRFFQASVTPAPGDIAPIAQWRPDEPLGSHVGGGERSVMILRSPLVSHLSETAIFLAKAEADGPYRKPGATQVQPLFRGSAGLDTAYFGFAITPQELKSEPGWYFVIQELGGATRFGLDEQATATLNTWNDLAWPNVAVSGGYVAVSQKQPAPAQPRGLLWGRDSAHMAAITLQLPVRLAIHTSLLVPQNG